MIRWMLRKKLLNFEKAAQVGKISFENIFHSYEVPDWKRIV